MAVLRHRRSLVRGAREDGRTEFLGQRLVRAGADGRARRWTSCGAFLLTVSAVVWKTALASGAKVFVNSGWDKLATNAGEGKMMSTRLSCTGAGLWRPLIAMGSACLLSAFSILVSAQAEAQDSPVYPSFPECEKVLDSKDITWELYFASHSDALTKRGEKVAVELASRFLRDHGRIVALSGNIDGAESITPDDRNLGARRAETVAREFNRVGIRLDQIFTKDLGFSKPLVPQLPTDAEGQNRRVVVIPMLAESDDLRERRLVCKAVIRTACLGLLKDEQRTLCEHALNILARN